MVNFYCVTVTLVKKNYIILMVLRSTPGAQGAAVYQVSGTASSRILPEWLIRKHKKSLKKDPEFATRVELIQDFWFEEASNRLKVTRDGQYAIATGTYKPQIHVYQFDQLSLKFSRHTDAENVDFVVVSDDWTKTVYMQTDRTIEFHNQGGIHTRTRIPKFGRSVDYNRASCDLYVGASGSDIYRLNLDQGRFLAPFECDTPAVNQVLVNPAHGLLGAAGENGTVEFWDPRSRARVGILDVGGASGIPGSGVTSLAYHNDGLRLAAGTYDGMVRLYDLRMSEPLRSKDQGYGFPVHRLGFLESSNTPNKIWSADKRIVKVWDTLTGDPYTSLEPSVDINDVCHLPDTGMFFMANEGSPMHTYYVPNIGPAPKWCSFLDSITEELEEKPISSVFENYKFVTRPELRKLGLDHLIGTNVVKSYMHGYFIDQRLYDEARLIANPFEAHDHREREIRKRIEKDRQSRIRTVGQGVKVNKRYTEQKEHLDDRFKAMFEDPEFQIDENSFEYKLLHGGKPGSQQIRNEERTQPRPLTAAEEEEQEEASSDHSDSSSASDDSDAGISARELRQKKQRRKAQQNVPQVEAIGLENKSEQTFGERLPSIRPSHSESTQLSKKNGATEITFVPRNAQKPKKQHDSGREAPRKDGTLRSASKNTFRRDGL